MILTCDLEGIQRPGVLALCARKLVQAAVLANRDQIIPPLYESGVFYRREPKGVETIRDVASVLRLGHGDCAHLAAWRCAELRNRGENARIRITWKIAPERGRALYHVQVRRGDGSVEDPSRILGM